MDEDSQSKGVRARSFQLRRHAAGLLRILLPHNTSPPKLWCLRVVALAVVAICATLSCVRVLSCRGAFGDAPASCSIGAPGVAGSRRQLGGPGSVQLPSTPHQPGGDAAGDATWQAAPWSNRSFLGKSPPVSAGRPFDGSAPPAAAVPVVQFYSRPGALACGRSHYIFRTLKQARSLNDAVYFIGPPECADMARELGVVLEPYVDYQDVLDWFERNLGKPIGYQVRWFVLRAFMERHALRRIFYIDSDVMLFANVTEVAAMLFPASPLVLSVRWPSLQPPLGPSQYPSTAVSGHVSLWGREALDDFLEFFVVFIQRATLSGKPGDKGLVELKAYNDMVVLGWYTFKACWVPEPKALRRQCAADKASGVTTARAARIRGRHTPRFAAESFCAPWRCNATRWADEGWCAFDNNFSIRPEANAPTQQFRYRPEEGMKCPTSMHYAHFEDWQKGPQTAPVQFLGVHFQAHKKGYLTRGDDPATTWGSAAD